MKKRTAIPFVCFVALFLSATCLQKANAQTPAYVVKGKIVDRETQQPLPGASVFAQNTTLGTVSDNDGNFRLVLPGGGYTLAITFTGYDNESVRVNQSLAADSLLVSLTAQVKSMEEVSIAISNEVKDGWLRYGEFFVENFIGKSAVANQCRITNPEALHFFFSKKRNRLKVNTSEPLIIENFALGYIVHCSIDSFIHDYNSNTRLFVTQPFFKEMEGTDEQTAQWKENRLDAYEGSMLHFMRSLYDRDLLRQNFELQFIVHHEGSAYPIALKDMYGAMNYHKDDSTGIVWCRPNQLEVALIYKQEPEKAYQDMDTTRQRTFQLSTLLFEKDRSIAIEENGFFYDQEDLITNGYLAFKKIGDMLPYDYLPFPDEQPAEIPQPIPAPDMPVTDSSSAGVPKFLPDLR